MNTAEISRSWDKMRKKDDSPPDPRRRGIIGTGAALFGVQLFPERGSAAELSSPEVSVAQSSTAPEIPPPGYNILFILVDQEHFFERWPFPVPGREWLKRGMPSSK